MSKLMIFLALGISTTVCYPQSISFIDLQLASYGNQSLGDQIRNSANPRAAVEGYIAAQKMKQEQIKLLQMRAKKVQELTTQCRQIESNWGSSTVRERYRCNAIKNFNTNGIPLSDELLFGP